MGKKGEAGAGIGGEGERRGRSEGEKGERELKE